jgi:surface antigen
MSPTPDKGIPAHEILVMLCADLEADGMLSPDHRAALGAVVAINPGLRDIYESFHFTRDPLARGFEPLLEASVPETLRRAVGKSPQSRARPAVTASVRAGFAWLGQVLSTPVLSPALAVPALAVSIAAGWLLGDSTSSNARSAIASAQAQHALEVTPSGVKVDVARGVRLEPRFTFATQEKAWCRQYALTIDEKQKAGGVACRDGDGVWQLVIETSLTAARPSPSKSPHIAGDPPLSDHEVILDSVRSQLKDGDVLGREEEEEHIAEHWKRKS